MLYYLQYKLYNYLLGEAIEKMLQEKKISSKINYDVLKSLKVSFADDGTSSSALLEPVQTEPEIILPPPKR